MPAVSYTVSNIGRRHEPPRHQIQEPYQYQDDGYGPVNNRDPYHYQDHGYGTANNDPYQDRGYGSVNRDPYQYQGYGYGTVNRGPYQGHGYGSVNRSPYHDHGYGSVINNPPPYMPFPREQSPDSDSVEWHETPEAHVYTAHLPGAKPSDVGVEVEDDRIMLIKCYKGVEEFSGYHVQDVHRLMLPDDSNTGQVRAHMENGVITVTVPKVNRFANRYGRNFNCNRMTV